MLDRYKGPQKPRKPEHQHHLLGREGVQSNSCLGEGWGQGLGGIKSWGLLADNARTENSERVGGSK